MKNLFLSFDGDCLTNLGVVGSDDSLIINDEVEDNVANVPGCFHTRSDGDSGTLSWNLDDCSPIITVSKTRT